ncbi:MAG: FAS1-like dehydratase domain-containing protein [Pseudomonadota bacterium]|jgi:acyl dehydratase
MAEYRFPVDASQIMLFARAIGDKNPIYYDAEYARGTEVGGIIAPPTFVQAAAQYDPNFPLRPRIGEPWFGSGREPTGVKPKEKSAADARDARKEGGIGQSARVLHAEQKFQYHRPIRPGDVLTVTTRPGQRWEKEGKRGGTLKFSETISEFRNQHGELVVTATMVGVETGQAVSQN